MQLADNQRQAVYELYRAGDTYTEIAIKLNLKCRNTAATVIYQGRKQGIDLPRREARERTNTFVANKPIKKERLPDTTEGVSLLDVNDSQCREIIGHMRCCGKEVVERGSKSYCLEHSNKNYAGVHRV